MSGFVHAALIVDSDESLRARLVPVLRRSLERAEPVLMVVSAHTERVVRDVLGRRSEALEWGDPAAFYQRLGFAFEGFRRYLAEQHAKGRRVHVVAEPDVGSGADPDEPIDRAAAYLSYESVCNEAYAGFGCPITCVWDSRRHPTLVIDGVRSLHNHEITDAGSTVNDGHITTAEYLAGRNGIPLPRVPAPTDVDLTLTGTGQLSPLRAALRGWAAAHGFDASACGDVEIAVTELATNGLVHGAPPVRVRAWRQAGTLLVQVDDAGGHPISVNAGYRPPDVAAGSGRGLWLARQLADVLTTHTSPGRTSVRLHFPHDITHQHSPGDGRA